MLGMSVAFWVIVFAIFMGVRRRRRWERWARLGDPRWFGPPGPWGPGGHAGATLPSPDRDAYVEQLETRVARLEERLDFTEKLLAERPAAKIDQTPEP
jgi:hypothetical protein